MPDHLSVPLSPVRAHGAMPAQTRANAATASPLETALRSLGTTEEWRIVGKLKGVLTCGSEALSDDDRALAVDVLVGLTLRGDALGSDARAALGQIERDPSTEPGLHADLLATACSLQDLMANQEIDVGGGYVMEILEQRPSPETVNDFQRLPPPPPNDPLGPAAPPPPLDGLGAARQCSELMAEFTTLNQCIDSMSGARDQEQSVSQRQMDGGRAAAKLLSLRDEARTLAVAALDLQHVLSSADSAALLDPKIHSGDPRWLELGAAFRDFGGTAGHVQAMVRQPLLLAALQKHAGKESTFSAAGTEFVQSIGSRVEMTRRLARALRNIASSDPPTAETAQALRLQRAVEAFQSAIEEPAGPFMRMSKLGELARDSGDAFRTEFVAASAPRQGRAVDLT